MKASTGRAPLDRYDTAAWMTEVLLRHVRELRGRLLLDPCAGNGTMAAQLRPRFQRVITNDLDPRTMTQRHRNACHAGLWEEALPDWTVTNPPFSHAGRIARHALDYSLRGVALLLPVTFLEVCKDRLWIDAEPPQRILVLPRTRFRGQATDRVTVAWHIWSREALRGPPIRCLGKDAPQRYAPAQAAERSGMRRAA